MIIPDIKSLPERVKRELIRGEHARAEFAICAQTRLREALGELGPARHIDGIGRKMATIHPELGRRIRMKYGARALHDPDFLRALLRDNPFLRVPTTAAKVTVRVNGRRDEEAQATRLPLQGDHLHEGGAGHGAQGEPATPSARGRETPARAFAGHETAGAALVQAEGGQA